MSKIKIGIIGTGYMGGTHAQLYARSERRRFTPFTTSDRKEWSAFRKQTGANVWRAASR
jgi:predicted dehydrogenase